MWKKLVDKEAELWENVIERAAEKYPDWFWNDPPKKPKRPWRLEPLLLDFWPSILSFSYWDYLLSGLHSGHYGGYEANSWINLPDPITDVEEWKWFLKDFKWFRLWEETKTERLICRFRGHPKGEVYWNPGGDEPDHHCQTCGEFIG